MQRKDLFNVYVNYEGATWVIATAEDKKVADQIKEHLERTYGKTQGFEFFITENTGSMYESLEDYIAYDEKVRKQVEEDEQQFAK